MRTAAAMLVALAACGTTAAPPPEGPFGPIEFRVLIEGSNETPCIEAPAFETAGDEGSWISIVDRHTECLPGGDIELPAVDFDAEVVVAAWWKRPGCRGGEIKTIGVQRRGKEVVVTAESTPPPDPCRASAAQLESFLALERGPVLGSTNRFTFVLDRLLVRRVP